MITTRMSVEEIIREFEKDKVELYARFKGFVLANKKSLLKIQKQKGKDYFVPCKGVRHSTINFNNYRACIGANFISGRPNIISVTYLLLNDSYTGRRIVYLMPAEKTDKGIITLAPSFFEDFNTKLGLNPESFTDSVDNYMKSSKKYTIYEQSDTGDPRYNCQVDLGNGWVGFGKLDSSKAMIKLRHFYTTQELIQEAEKNGYPEKDPLKIFLKLRRGDEEKEISKEELSEKQREIDAAWEEFENSYKD